MPAQAVVLHLPGSLYDHFMQRAKRARRSLEEELLKAVESARTKPAADIAPENTTAGRGKSIPPSPLVIDDTEVLSGNWTWRSDADGKLSFQSRRR